ncbi:MAG: hypothetical protein Q8O55_03925 [Dehalococcoidales bacterium]|nr:hypothetical protein [Dehalococcoidales bacterium]
MDLYCKRCGEPYDMDNVNFEMTTLERIHFKDGRGCPSCYGHPAPEKRPLRAKLQEAAEDVMGDDMDGVAAMMEDAELEFGEDF